MESNGKFSKEFHHKPPLFLSLSGWYFLLIRFQTKNNFFLLTLIFTFSRRNRAFLLFEKQIKAFVYLIVKRIFFDAILLPKRNFAL